jgi:hypothetical protein
VNNTEVYELAGKNCQLTTAEIAKKKVLRTIFIRPLEIAHGLAMLALACFLKTVIFTSSMLLKLEKWTKNGIFWNFEILNFFYEIVLKLFLCAPRLEKRENSRKKFENRSILANFSPF